MFVLNPDTEIHQVLQLPEAGNIPQLIPGESDVGSSIVNVNSIFSLVQFQVKCWPVVAFP